MSSTPSESEPTGARRYRRVGKYELLGHIATGGMGAVYKARDTELGREVALKIIPPELANKPVALERFRQEARHAAKLRHENIVTLFEFGEADGTYFLAMELVNGIDLHEYISRKGKLKPHRARRILIQAARALEHAHRQGIVHRDIKPGNFLVTRRDSHLLVKLTDLGLAREAADDEFRVTREGSTVGSIDYMSPEQARDSRAADIRSDLYSLGCTLYHMLAGRPPFNEGSLTERIFKHIEDEPPDVRTFNPETTPDLRRALRRMLAKKPEDRYQTPAELLEDLARGDRPEPAGRDAGSSDAIDAGPPAAQPSSSAMLLETLPPAPSSGSGASRTPPPAARPGPSPAPRFGVGTEQRRAAAGQYERARQLLAEGNPDYAVQLLLSCCKLDPAQLVYRQALRQAEKLKYQNNRPGGPLTWLAKRPKWLRLKAAARTKDHVAVLAAGEDILAQDPWDVGAQLDMAEAADGLGLMDLAIWLLEEARLKDVRDVRVNRALARLYEKSGNLSQAIALWDLVRKVDPTDGEAFQKVNDLAAKETILRGRYVENVQRGPARGGRRTPPPE
jgi:serine/threonine protein kinase